MNEKDIFKDMREQMEPDPEVISRLVTAIEADALQSESSSSDKESTQHPQSGKQAVKRRGSNRIFRISGAAAAAIFLVLIASGTFLVDKTLTGTAPNQGSTGTLIAQADDAVRRPADYQELYTTIEEVSFSNTGGFGLFNGTDGAVAETAATVDAQAFSTDSDQAQTPTIAPEAADYANAKSSSSSAAGDYTETNVQVEGIDESDIVKTDGNYIYVLSNNELVIFKAEGESTTEVSRTSIRGAVDEYSWSSATELYLSQNTVIVLRNEYLSTPTEDPSAQSSKMVMPGYAYGQSWTTASFYDVSDPGTPRLIQDFGQSGDYSSSRLNGDTLYLISRYWLYNPVDHNEPGTFVPLLKEGSNSSIMNVEDIRIMPTVSNVSYTVVTSYNVASPERIDQKSVLGDASTVYMSHENLYLGSTIFSEETKEPYQESVYTVEEHIEKQMTQIIRIGVSDGLLDVAAQCTIEGSLLNQFSLDEYEGNLRIVMTLSDYSYKILKDESHDVEVYQPNEDSPMTNALYILDSSLSIKGSITGMAEDERIYSARFDGPVGYMVTYRQMDPLFALDLSDPTSPQITSELKIPGFSTYLHPFSEGLLLGLGYDAQDAVTQGMKISMFDVADPFDVSELAATSVDAFYSEALDNHKAALVDKQRNIIGFPIDSESAPYYLIYGYDEGSGLVLRASLELSAYGDGFYYYGSYGTRGLVIGENLYVISNSYLDIFRLDGFEKLASIKVQTEAEPGYVSPMPLMID